MSQRTVRNGLLSLAAAVALTATVIAGPATAMTSRTAAPGHDPGPGHGATQAALDATVAAGAPGAQGQAENGQRTWFGSAGKADLKTGQPLRQGDRFRVGSITKSFVATVVLQLEAEHRLSLDDTVQHWLPGVVQGHGNDGSKITIRQLLNHTSGIFNYTEDPTVAAEMSGPGFIAHRYDSWTLAQLVKVAVGHPPTFAPGTGWRYSNTNYVLAGMIIEKVTGHFWGDEVRRRVIEPLGLRSTTVPGTSPAVPGHHGRAYSTLGSADPHAPVIDVTEFNPSIAGSAGEIISTAGDLGRFYRELLRGRLLPARQLNELLTTVSTRGGIPGVRYGLGIYELRLPCGVSVWGHSGGIFGSLSDAGATRDGSHAFAFNMNADWVGNAPSTVQAEFCGTTGGSAPRAAAPAL